MLVTPINLQTFGNVLRWSIATGSFNQVQFSERLIYDPCLRKLHPHYLSSAGHSFRCYVMKANKNYYDILGVTPKATRKQIKTAYYLKSKQYHPDVNKEPNAQVKFAEISEAYEILGNPITKNNYDRGFGNFTDSSNIDVEYEEFMKKTGQYGRRRSKPMTGKTAHFNFDEFYREHYDQSIRDTKMRAEEKIKYDIDIEVDRKRKNTGIIFSMTVAFIIITIMYEKTFR